MFAHVTAGVVDSVGQPPQLVYQDDRWWDLRDRDPATLALVGWYPVTESPKPADTASTKWTPLFTVNGATVTQSWMEVAKTAEEIAADTATVNEANIRDKARQALTANATFLALASPTNAQTLAQVQRLTREATALIKLTLRELADTSGT